MNPAEKGERYARIFRKAGIFLGKGNIVRAIEVFKQGVDLARGNGDEKMAERFQNEITGAQSESRDSDK